MRNSQEQRTDLEVRKFESVGMQWIHFSGFTQLSESAISDNDRFTAILN